MAAGRSTPLRRAGSFLALLAFEVAALALLTRLGGVSELRIPWHSLTPWLLNSPVEVVLAAVLRTIALLIAWWLLGSNLLYLLVSLTRAGQQLAEKAAPNALAITRETLAPLDAKERETLMALLNRLR